jgi:translation initiation factor 3 subunit C
MLQVAGNAFQKVKVLLALIPSEFDYNASAAGHMPTNLWKSTRSHIDQLLTILEVSENITVADFNNDELEVVENETVCLSFV